MNKFRDSIVLMGVNWSKAARLEAVKDIRREHPKTFEIIRGLDKYYRRRN